MRPKKTTVALAGAFPALALSGTPANDHIKVTSRADTIHGMGGDAPGDHVDCRAGMDAVQRRFPSSHDVFVN